MRVTKGEVVLTISPSDWNVYRKAGWKRKQERSREKTAEYNARQKMKMLAKGKAENVE